MGFENDRKWIIEKKNDVAIKAMDNKERTDQFIEKRDEVEEGISRIPTDLPEEIQRQVDANDLKDESEKLESEANDIQRDADEVMDMADAVSGDLKEKGNRLKDLRGIPIIGSFAETKGDEVLDQAEQIVDLNQDDLISSRNRLMGNR